MSNKSNSKDSSFSSLNNIDGNNNTPSSPSIIITNGVNGSSINGNSSPSDNLDNVSTLSNHDLEILIKMEHMNREMEVDTKSAQSILLKTTDSTTPTSLSRRPSLGSSELNNSMNNDDASKNDEVTWELWNQIINEWTLWSKKKTQLLNECIRKGIPQYFRPLVWQYLCGVNLTNLKDTYKEYLKKTSTCEKVIRRDIDRTYPDHDLFRNGNGQEMLFNIMKAYSIYDPEVGYCQGSAFITGLLLIQNVPEEEAFAILVQIMQQYNLRDVYKPNMYHLGLYMYQLECWIEDSLPDLYAHFVSNGFHTSMYSSSWFLTLFTTSLPLSLVCRIIDVFLIEGFEIIFRVGLALLDYHKDNLMCLDMEGMLKYFQKEIPAKHELDHETILNKAYAIKYNAKKMKKLEKDYSILKKDEQDEQIELTRLKTENKILKQRIENLEKESVHLAERLIHGQVLNAQNTESIFALKNENIKLQEANYEYKAKIEEYENEKQLLTNVDSNYVNEIQLLNDRIDCLVEENNRLRQNPDTQRLEEELVEVKLKGAEAELAITELQKTIHVLNLEFQEFVTQNNSSNPTKTDTQILEEELLKVKMREAETLSEMKAMSLKLMQMETEKHVAYNQIKRQDEEMKKLNAQLHEYQEKDLDMKNQILEYRHQLDDKEAQVKELNMSHKLKELEDSHVIAELRQSVASLEVQVQELVTAVELNGDHSGSEENKDDMRDDKSEYYCDINNHISNMIDLNVNLDDSFCLQKLCD